MSFVRLGVNPDDIRINPNSKIPTYIHTYSGYVSSTNPTVTVTTTNAIQNFQSGSNLSRLANGPVNPPPDGAVTIGAGNGVGIGIPGLGVGVGNGVPVPGDGLGQGIGIGWGKGNGNVGIMQFLEERMDYSEVSLLGVLFPTMDLVGALDWTWYPQSLAILRLLSRLPQSI